MFPDRILAPFWYLSAGDVRSIRQTEAPIEDQASRETAPDSPPMCSHSLEEGDVRKRGLVDVQHPKIQPVCRRLSQTFHIGTYDFYYSRKVGLVLPVLSVFFHEGTASGWHHPVVDVSNCSKK